MTNTGSKHGGQRAKSSVVEPSKEDNSAVTLNIFAYFVKIIALLYNVRIPVGL